MHNIEDVKKETLLYFNGDTIATNVWIDKYCLKDLDENLLEKSPDDMHIRIAKELARIETKYKNPLAYEEIYNLLRNFSYIVPGGSILFGCGNDYAVSSLGNCFVIGGGHDSYGGIMAVDEEQVQLMKRRGGVGHDLSHLRHKSSPVTNSAKTSTGILPFMERYSNSTREVAQDGRRGALMLSLDVDHKDIDAFVTSKDDTTKITGANISVKVNDAFMGGLMQNMLYKNTSPNLVTESVNRIWGKIIHQAWKTAEPGVLFIDTIRKQSPADCYSDFGFRTVSTNPCGEIPLCPYDSCRLLSVILPSFVINPFTNKAYFDFNKFKEVVRIAQRLMDDIVDLEEEKIDAIIAKIKSDIEPEDIKSRELNLWLKIKEKLLQGRRTGLSGIGLADVAAMLNIKFDDIGDMAEEIYKTLAISAYKSSIELAEERGCFPIWDYNTEKDNPFINRILVPEDFTGVENAMDHQEMIKKWYKFGRRNIALLTIPPSGTISLMAGISSGIEPVFMSVHGRKRKVKDDNPNKSFQDKNGDWWEEYYIVHPCLLKYLESVGQTIKTMTYNPYDGSTANEIDPMKKIDTISRIQQWVDHSISQTLNLPADVTEETVGSIYYQAWAKGLKGVTIYRDGCRDGVLTDISSKPKETFKQHDAPKRPKTLPCDIRKVMVGGREWIVCIGLYDGKPFEVFAFENKWGTSLSKKSHYTGTITKVTGGEYDLVIDKVISIKNITGLMTQGEEDRTRMISTSLRHGANVKFIIEQLSKPKNIDITSFSKAIARVLKFYIKDGEISTESCKICGGQLIYNGGCAQCSECGDSKCG